MCACPEFEKNSLYFPPVLREWPATGPSYLQSGKGLSACDRQTLRSLAASELWRDLPQCGFLAAAAFGVGLLAAGLELPGADCPWSSSCRTWRASAILALASSSEQGLLAVEVDVVDVDDSAARSAMMRSLAWVSVHCTLPALGTLEVTGLVKSTFLAYRSARVC